MLPTLFEAVLSRRGEVLRSADLTALAERLERLLAPLLEGDVLFPRVKALLSRDGGVCAADGARLLFDPLSPNLHRCPRCGQDHEGVRHHRAWVWRYHIWLSERAVHLALLGALKEDRGLADRARIILELYAASYRSFPNSDNVLGPTRLFFSTYLESIWLAQLVTAALFIRSGWEGAEGSIAGFDVLVKESASLIASFDEGWSNRQVWNNTALVAAGLWLGGAALPAEAALAPVNGRLLHKFLAHGLDGPHGICSQLVSAVTDEGMWFEGENYHFFALRGFILAAELSRVVGVDLYGDDGPTGRLRDMFVAPLRTVLPNLDLPARGDSPYGVSLLQPRFAELWEVGLARTGDERIESLLNDLYSTDAPEGDDRGLEELAEQEQNRPAQRLHRALLGWKALWLMNRRQPETPGRLWRIGSTLLPQAGVAVLRNGPTRYLSLECGGDPGGHGHPDLLHLTLYDGLPLLMDFGTASYVSPSLHWYRSSRAHNAPGEAGQDQRVRRGWCAAIDQRGCWCWCKVVAEDLFGAGTSATRTVVMGEDCVLDLVDVEGAGDLLVDLPVHLLDPAWAKTESWLRLPGASNTRDDRFGDIAELAVSDSVVLNGERHTVILRAREGERLLVCEDPGPPDSQFADGEPKAYLIRRARGAGRWIQCYGSNAAMPTQVRVRRNTIHLEYRDGTAERITIKEDSCRVVDRNKNTHKLGGARLRPAWRSIGKPRPRVIACPTLDTMPTVADWEAAVPRSALVELGAAHYRRSEQPYGSGRQFASRVAVFVVGSKLCFGVNVKKKDATFRQAATPNPELDNETPDIHSDGVQVFLGAGGAGEAGVDWRGYLLVPDPDSDAVRVLGVAGMAGDTSKVDASWVQTADGYSVLVSVELGEQVQRGQRIPVNVVVNEMYSNRERRAGQLALSGGGWVYLRGDREHPSSAILAEVS